MRTSGVYLRVRVSGVSLRAVLMVLLLIGMCLLAARAFGADPAPPPMQWSQAWTQYGPVGSTVDLSWTDPNVVKADFYEVSAVSLERPSQTVSWRWGVPELTVVRRATSQYPDALFITRPKLKLPGSGHWTIIIRTCQLDQPSKQPPAVTATCAESSSLDPTFAEVNGKPQAWWLYGYTLPPKKVTPIPSIAPKGSPPVTVAKAVPTGQK